MRTQKPEEFRRRRSIFLVGIITVMLIALGAQLASTTLMHQAAFLQAAEEQRTRNLPVYAPRGLIYDSNMEPLVTNQPGFSVFIRYPYYKQEDVLQRIADILAMPVTEVKKLVDKKVSQQRYYEPVRLKDGITQQQYATILERKNELPGVEVQAHPSRVYPNKGLAAHTLGYVNEVSADDISGTDAKKYIGGELIGRTGLEAYYDAYLRGTPGMRQVEVNNYFQPLGEIQSVDPKPGNSLVLTIDAGLQRVAERALDWDMWRIRNTVIGDGPWPNARAGAVVVMDVKTGAILAMASHPGFDPNQFARGITEAELTQLRDPVLTPEVNRTLQSYQPGSTWKMMTSAAALTYGVVAPHEQLFCSGTYDKAGHPKDWVTYGHGWVDTVTALKNSCDIYYYEMGYRLGPDKLTDMAKQFGFGSKTGVDVGGEDPGLLPDAKNREQIWGLQLKDPWSIGHTVSSAIGQIVQVTPLQLARYVATLGNGGKVMQPYLVQKIIDGQGQTVKEFGPKQVGQVGIKPEHLQTILDGMAAVTAPGVGTSDYAYYPLSGIRTGGKTGSAEYPPHDDFGFFVTLAPIDNPQIAIAAVIEQGMHGGNVAAVNRAIQAAYFKVPLPESDPANVPKEFPTDIAGLRRKFRVVGTGN